MFEWDLDKFHIFSLATNRSVGDVGIFNRKRYLRKRKLERLELVAATHSHSDHIEGLSKIVEKYMIDILIANEDISENKNYSSFFEIVKEKEIEFKQAKRGDVINRFKGADVEILHPDKLTGNRNYDALVIKLTYKNISFYLHLILVRRFAMDWQSSIKKDSKAMS